MTGPQSVNTLVGYQPVSAPPRLGVLVSGRGSNLRALVDAYSRGVLPAPVAVVVSNRADAGALEYARDKGIPTAVVSRKTHEDPGAALLACLYEHEVDVVVLAGYLAKLDPRVVLAYTDRAINIHPAPLPRFGGKGMYGEHVHRAVLQAGVPLSGPTVHRVSNEYDEGEILAHQPVPVLPGDDPHTLAARVLKAEHDLLWRVIRNRFCPAT
ncbi:phosphoribosylglycinamide formyltransferase [Paraliomyxa miuraensis]|uniref:phosphoribosylglycinamide formyltransferase n=1 Tax=Paraliomyxa miuraensis TaxID=376150 RepID=UPI002253B3F3|nr:phosphoribosylglycinamide formyltransferase [Paraliomyxa miuraensis]MCX4242332.1 phosphoribosylglycinamide formyltransferase [Paraliomyxa miuraensis]